ncbi:hypothetical protein D9M68_465840 [compost metagenome]
MQLFLDARLVGADGLVADRQLLADIVVGHPLGQHLQDAQFAAGKHAQFIASLGVAANDAIGREIVPAMQHGADRLFQDRQVVVLADETVGTGLVAEPGEMLGALRGVHQDPGGGVARSDTSYHLETAEFRQQKLQHHQLRMQLLRLVQGRPAIVGQRNDLMTIAHQQFAEGPANHRQPIDDHRPGHAHAHRPL